jgi:hypothetical protein
MRSRFNPRRVAATREWAIRFAQENFSNFLNRLSAAQSRHVGLGERDPELIIPIDVTSEEVLDKFLVTS